MMSNKSPRAKVQHGYLSTGSTLELSLYIAGNAPNSLLAVNNLAAICEEFLVGRHQLEIIDVLITPLRALNDGVLVTPSLTVTSAGTEARIVGNLNDRNGVLRTMGIK